MNTTEMERLIKELRQVEQDLKTLATYEEANFNRVRLAFGSSDAFKVALPTALSTIVINELVSRLTEQRAELLAKLGVEA